MCGMTGWVDFAQDLTRERAVIEAMTETMACRGPDAAGTWIRRDVALGHRRLAVIDLAGGAQPMVVSIDLGLPGAQAGDDPRPDGGQAALLLPDSWRDVVQLGGFDSGQLHRCTRARAT